MSTRSTAKIISGSAPRSSPGIYNTDPATMFSVKPSSIKTPSVKSATTKTATANTPISSSKTRLLTVPVAIVSAVTEASEATATEGKSSFLRYMIIIIILGFLGLTLFLYLEKPADKSLVHLYDPILKYLGMDTEEKVTVQKAAPQKASDSAVNKLEKALDKKTVVNKIDKDEDTDEEDNKKEVTSHSGAEEQATNLLKRTFKKKPVIPEPDEATISKIQSNKPKSKSGFCYIGEDTGTRSCIKVGEGDVCMSGDIFPTQAVCINPNLRE
jgi:hypothetical protein